MNLLSWLKPLYQPNGLTELKEGASVFHSASCYLSTYEKKNTRCRTAHLPSKKTIHQVCTTKTPSH